MLILSRKPEQTIQFPNLGISIEILQVKGRTVKVGIKAPRDISVLRGEITQPVPETASGALPQARNCSTPSIAAQANSTTQPGDAPTQSRQERHELRNRIHAAKFALYMLQRQISDGQIDKADKALERALSALGNLDAMAAQPVAVRESLGTPGACKALIVEDNANERHLMVGFLEMCGYTVDAVEDGYAALGYLAENEKPDIILLDVNMPGLDGPSTVAAIRNNPQYSDIKLFMVSGEDRESVSVAEGDGGIQQWFSKPLEPASFANDLARTLAGSV